MCDLNRRVCTRVCDALGLVFSPVVVPCDALSLGRQLSLWLVGLLWLCGRGIVLEQQDASCLFWDYFHSERCENVI